MADEVAAVTPDSVVRRRDDLAAVEVDDETIIYDPVAEMLHHLDKIATVVWRELDGGETLATLAADLASAFGTDPDVVLDDVQRLTRQLLDDGLVVVEGDDGG